MIEDDRIRGYDVFFLPQGLIYFFQEPDIQAEGAVFPRVGNE